MSDTTDTLDAMRTKLRELELDHVQLAGRILELNECIALVEHGPRRRGGRPRKGDSGKGLMQLCPDGVIRPVEMPQWVGGGISEPDTDEHLVPESAA